MPQLSSLNTTVRITTSIFGVLLAIAGFEHGFFETLQGNTATSGLIIQAIGKDMQWWKYGSEEAFTIISNFLVTGLLVMLTSAVIMAWSIFFIHQKRAPSVFLILFIILTMVGGGIGFTPFYLVVWAYARKIHSPLMWWKESFTPKTILWLSRLWPYTLAIAVLSLLIAIELAIFGYFPGVTNPDLLLGITWSLLLVAMIFINLTYFSSFAKDIHYKVSSTGELSLSKNRTLQSER